MSNSKVVNEARNGHARNGSAAKPQAADERDARGRFVKGNLGGPGNPFGRQLATYRAQMMKVVTVKDIEDIAYMLLVKAKGGDLAAAKLLLLYTVGKPAPAEDPDRQELEEWKLLREAAAKGEDVQTSFEALPLDIANFMVKTRKFAQSVEQGERIATEVNAGLAERAERQAKKEKKAAARRRREELLASDWEEAPSANGEIGEWDLGNGNGNGSPLRGRRND